jgi:Rod binding domain-containing protein
VSVGAIGGATPLPPGAEKRTDAERAGLGFERMLLVQLTQQLAKTAEPEGEGASVASAAYRDLLPGALADAIVAGGGIGLGDALAAQVEAAAGAASAPRRATTGEAASGGAAA